MSHTPFKDGCPNCGHKFTLEQLKEMAVGDGWQRHLLVRFDDGTEGIVSFDEFWPVGMKAIERRSPPRL